MPLETFMPLDVVEEVADLVRLDAQLSQHLPPHVCSALALRCKSSDAEVLSARAAPASRDATDRAKACKRIHSLLSIFESALATAGRIPGPTSGNVIKMYQNIFDARIPTKVQNQIEEIWQETRWTAKNQPTGPIASLWQGVHRGCALAAIDERCEAVGLILVHAHFLQVHGAVLPWSVAIPVIAKAGSGPRASRLTGRDLITAYRCELNRLIPAYQADSLQRQLRELAIQDCRVERVGPVIDAMFKKPSISRGEVHVLAQVSGRTARRDIQLMMDTGWATADSAKGHLRLAIPQTAARTVMDHGENASG